MAFEVFVGVEVLAGGVDVGVAEELLHRYDVGAALKKPRGVGMSEFVEGGVFNLGLRCDSFQGSEEMAGSPALGIGENPFGGPGEIL